MSWIFACQSLSCNCHKLSKNSINLSDEFVTDNIYFATGDSILSKNKTKVIKSKRFVMVGDVRIDNRAAIKNFLGVKQEFKEEDEKLFLSVFEKLGFDGLNYIVGDFVVILYDVLEHRFICIRDQLGMKTLFFKKSKSEISFASDLIFLVDGTETLQSNYFVRFYELNGIVDEEITPYPNVVRIPSGHFLIFQKGTFELKKYWDLNMAEKDIRYPKKQEYEEQFLKILSEAVVSRISENYQNSVLMSGGLDSTSIFALGKLAEKECNNFSLLAVSGVFDRLKESDEREYIEPVLQLYSSTFNYEICDDYGMLNNFPYDVPWHFEPAVNALTFGFTGNLLRKAAELGCKVALTGYGGDQVLGGSHFFLADKFKLGYFKEFFTESFVFSKKTRLSYLKTILLMASSKATGFNSDFTNINQAMENAITSLSTQAKKHIYFQVQNAKAFNFLDKVISTNFGIEVRYPFLDRRLIEFVFNIPGDLIWKEGRTKVILRNAMKGKLPDQNVNRKNKTVNLDLTFSGIKNVWANLQPALSEGRVCKIGLIKKSEWEKCTQYLRQGMLLRDDFWLLIALELWLYRWEKRSDFNLWPQENFKRMELEELNHDIYPTYTC